MRKILLTAGLFIFCVVNAAWATPPSSIDLSYDPENKNLHIEIAHASHDPRAHHIRKVEVTRNDDKPIDLYFATQTTPAMLTTDVPLEAKEGDTIRVVAICSEAGRKEETLVIPKEEKTSPEEKTPLK